ncbi:superoxide dismutase family protein [Limnohabitans sp.]|uniref:superoxide dismutase family protein n=1 Tax=Limnohabitans sp. TaxID=1907725 RepID=UPI00286F4FFE|nr:superoxide dismutase family protein [Limnohabitans sp.]
MPLLTFQKTLSRSAGVLAVVITGCASYGSSSPTLVSLQSTKGYTAVGEMQLSQVPQGVRLQGQVSGLKPGAQHGFHVHEKGDCSAPDATSAGGHFNPHSHDHGLHTSVTHHAGDLPALQADAQGVAKLDVLMQGLSLSAGVDSIRGKALVVHRDPDDGRSQPTGNSGPRVACGVIPL